MYSLASRPAGVPSLTAARRRSPAEMCTRPYFSTMSSHCVPLPEAGAPAIITRLGPAATTTERRAAARGAVARFFTASLEPVAS